MKVRYGVLMEHEGSRVHERTGKKYTEVYTYATSKKQAERFAKVRHPTLSVAAVYVDEPVKNPARPKCPKCQKVMAKATYWYCPRCGTVLNPRMGMGQGIFHLAGRDRFSVAIIKYLNGDAKALDRMPAIKAQIDRAIGQMRTATGNPSLYKAFHGAVPQVVKVKYNPPKPGEKLVAIGTLEEVVYKPFGSSKRKGITYSHKAGDTGEGILPGKMILASSTDGQRLYLLPGTSKAKMTERGLIG